MDDIEKIRKRFAMDRYATDRTGAVIEDVSEGFARCSFEITDFHKNALGNVMGGAVFTLADFTFAAATNAGGREVVSVASTINFSGVAKGSRLIAEAKCVKDGRTICVYEITVTDDIGSKVAFVTTTGFIKS
ncbi:MAG: PaaI family thioesterase [Clostridia bacterium]|nr:PaaI family thioesterase [Clostridia bacterium]